MNDKQRPKIDRAYYNTPEFRKQLAEDCKAMANDPEYQAQSAAWMNAPMGPLDSDPVIILQAKLEQATAIIHKLKAAIADGKFIHRDDCTGNCTFTYPGMPEIIQQHNANMDAALKEADMPQGDVRQHWILAERKRCMDIVRNELPNWEGDEGYIDVVIFHDNVLAEMESGDDAQ